LVTTAFRTSGSGLCTGVFIVHAGQQTNLRSSHVGSLAQPATELEARHARHHEVHECNFRSLDLEHGDGGLGVRRTITR
jgi:hypothetical protein